MALRGLDLTWRLRGASGRAGVTARAAGRLGLRRDASWRAAGIWNGRWPRLEEARLSWGVWADGSKLAERRLGVRAASFNLSWNDPGYARGCGWARGATRRDGGGGGGAEAAGGMQGLLPVCPCVPGRQALGSPHPEAATTSGVGTHA